MFASLNATIGMALVVRWRFQPQNAPRSQKHGKQFPTRFNLVKLEGLLLFWMELPSQVVLVISGVSRVWQNNKSGKWESRNMEMPESLAK